MLATTNITVQFGAKPLFDNISIKFSDGYRYGLIGANGSGKSTFMRILASELAPSSGQVSLGKGERLAWLRQDQFAFEDSRVIDVVLMGHHEMWQCLQEKDRIYADLEATESDYMKAAELESQFAEFDGYSAEARASELLSGLGLEPSVHNESMQAVAPGLKLRVLLAQALFADPDILLLDEPTNNLDIHTIRWLENLLNARNSTMIIVSHDRHFLNQICTHMADIDYRTITVYPGNYDEFMEASTLARERQMAANAKSKDKINQLEEFVRRFRAHKAKARQATSRLKQIDRLKVEEMKPSSRQYPYIRFEFDDKQKLHRKAVDLSQVSIGYTADTSVLNTLTLSVDAGEKIAVIGGNAVGKSTLMKALVGELEPQTGQIKWAEKADIGYFPQDHGALFDSDESLVDWLSKWPAVTSDQQSVRSVLGRLLFTGDDVLKPVRVLSGGEKGRMLLGRLMLQQHNVLLLDEPTNHMDMEAIESINQALALYKGTVIFVSHDREFVQSLASRIIEITPRGQLNNFIGDYDSYLVKQGLE